MHQVQAPDNRPLLSIVEAATLAGLSKSAAYRLAAAGVLPGLVRLPGARLLVRRRVLEAWLDGVESVDRRESVADVPAPLAGDTPARARTKDGRNIDGRRYER